MGPTDRIVEAIARDPWVITPDAMELVLGVVRRELSDPQAAAAIRTERRDRLAVQSPGGVAVIPITGVLTPYASKFDALSGVTSVQMLRAQFAEALSDPAVSSIVLAVDSPGGNASGIHEFARQIYAARDVKKVVTYVSNLGCSGGYWLATAASEVVADRTASVGSIGVLSMYRDDSKAREASGVVTHEIVSSQSPKKNLTPATDEGRAETQARVDALADIFIGEVAAFRGVDTNRVAETFGRGGVVLAEQAVKLGMIDRLGSLQSVVAELAGQSGIKGETRMGTTTTGAPATTPTLTCQERVAALRSADAEVVAAIREEAIREERMRIQAICALNTKGFEDLARAAMFEQAVNAEQLELQMFREQRKREEAVIKSHKGDATQVGNVPSSPMTGTTPSPLVAQIAAGGRRKKEG